MHVTKRIHQSYRSQSHMALANLENLLGPARQIESIAVEVLALQLVAGCCTCDAAEFQRFADVEFTIPRPVIRSLL